MAKHDEPLIKRIGTAIEDISALWRGPQPAPTEEQVTKTHEKLKESLQAMVEKQG
jgi:hypothetical protein